MEDTLSVLKFLMFFQGRQAMWLHSEKNCEWEGTGNSGSGEEGPYTYVYNQCT